MTRILGKVTIVFAALCLMVPALARGSDEGFTNHGNNPGTINGQTVDFDLLLLTSVVAHDVYTSWLQLRWPEVELSQISECLEAAQDGCGSTGICSVCVCNGSCSFICRDYFGHCPDNPPACCPRPAQDPLVLD